MITALKQLYEQTTR